LISIYFISSDGKEYKDKSLTKKGFLPDLGRVFCISRILNGLCAVVVNLKNTKKTQKRVKTLETLLSLFYSHSNISFSVHSVISVVIFIYHGDHRAQREGKSKEREGKSKDCSVNLFIGGKIHEIT
jgi:hypothetical protein